MPGAHALKVTFDIKAPVEEVWRGLTDPDMIRQYFFGTNAISDWKKGSSLKFTGEWEGKSYEDKGFILDIQPPKLLKYSYWSAFSGTADAPENYANITYELKKVGDKTLLVITQDGLANEEAVTHSTANWKSVIEGLKKLLE